jgi:hypothetical protein
MATSKGRLEILQKIRDWANEKLTTEQIKNNLYFPHLVGKKLSYDSKSCEMLSIAENVQMGRLIIIYYKKEKAMNDCLANFV